MVLIRVGQVCGRFELCYCTRMPFECFDLTLLPLCNGYEGAVVAICSYLF
jgi:hypothetical protein